VATFVVFVTIMTCNCETYSCIPPPREYTLKCAKAFDSLNFKTSMLNGMYNPKAYNIPSMRVELMLTSYMRYSGNVSDECVDAVEKLVCASSFYYCDSKDPMMLSHLRPCASACQYAEDVCPDDFFASGASSMCTSSPQCFDLLEHDQVHNCYGHYSNGTTCSGHGRCVSDNTCECDLFYSGDQCENSPPPCLSIQEFSNTTIMPFCYDTLSAMDGYSVNTESYSFFEWFIQDNEASILSTEYNTNSLRQSCADALKKIICIDTFPRCYRYPDEVDRIACPALCDSAFIECGPKLFKNRYPHDLCTSASIPCTSGEDIIHPGTSITDTSVMNSLPGDTSSDKLLSSHNINSEYGQQSRSIKSADSLSDHIVSAATSPKFIIGLLLVFAVIAIVATA
jgi:hypothetical protein